MTPVALALALALLCCSCNRDPKGEDASGADEGPARPPYPVIVVAEEPDHLAPPLARSASSSAVWPWILPSLVRIETDSLSRGRIVGDLARRWEIAEDGREARFFLSPDRFWEDTTSVTPEDVVESYRLCRDPTVGGEWGARLAEIASIETLADSPWTVLMRFRKGVSTRRALQLAALPVISKAQWIKNRDRHPIVGEPGRPVLAAGPFRVEEWKQGEFIRLARHPFPPPGREPAAERVLIRFSPLGISRAMQVEGGVADLAIDMPVEEIRRIREEGGAGARIVRAGVVATDLLLWNLEHPVLGGLGPRLWVEDQIDLDLIRRAAADGDSTLEGEPIDALPGQPDSSGAILAAGGEVRDVPAAFGISTLEILYDATRARMERMAVEILAQLDQAGVEAKLAPRPAAECLARLRDGRFEAALVGHSIPPLGDPGEFWSSRGSANLGRFSNAAVDSMVDAARSAAGDTLPDPARAIEQMVRRRHAAIIIERRVRYDLAGPRLAGYRRDPLQPYGDLLHLRLQ